MGRKLYVGNLPYSATDQILHDTFSQCGTVESAKIIMDRDTGRSKGFGFVEMSTDAEAADAITKFNGADYDVKAVVRPVYPAGCQRRMAQGWIGRCHVLALR